MTTHTALCIVGLYFNAYRNTSPHTENESLFLYAMYFSNKSTYKLMSMQVHTLFFMQVHTLFLPARLSR